MSARYLLRLDDACAGMNRQRWTQVEQLLDELAIRPIVAIVPDNRDPELDHGQPIDDVWARARAWQEKGWAIALHGYQHVMHPVTTPQYLPFHDRSEFVGLSLDEQAGKIRHLESARLGTADGENPSRPGGDGTTWRGADHVGRAGARL